MSDLSRYAELLATEGTIRGLIGPREVPRLWDRHLLNSAVLGELLPQGAHVADIGTGSGLPGLVIAITRPDLSITLIEPLLRRTTFLNEVVEELKLANVTVVRGKADLLHGLCQFDVVTSRAVAPLPRLLEWSMPLVRPNGSLIAMKGSSVSEEIDEASSTLNRLGCGKPLVIDLGVGVLENPTVALQVSWAKPHRIDEIAPGFDLRALHGLDDPEAHVKAVRASKAPSKGSKSGESGSRKISSGSKSTKSAASANSSKTWDGKPGSRGTASKATKSAKVRASTKSGWKPKSVTTKSEKEI